MLSVALFGCSEPASTGADTLAAAPNEAAPQQTAAADDLGPAAPAPPDSPPQPSAETVTEANSGDDGFYSQILTLRTDDPSVAILRATWLGEDGDVDGLGSNTISYTEFGDDHGIECTTQELVLYLSNKAVASPRARICDTWQADIASTWPTYDTSGLAAPPELSWSLYQMPPQPEIGLDFPTARLSYSVPETDAVAFAAQCNLDSGFIDAEFYLGVEQEYPEAPAQIDLIAGDTLYRFDSEWAPPPGDGPTQIPALRLPASHPLWASLSGADTADILLETGAPFRMALRDGRENILNYIAACAYQPDAEEIHPSQD